MLNAVPNPSRTKTTGAMQQVVAVNAPARPAHT